MNGVISFLVACVLYLISCTVAYGKATPNLSQKQWFSGSKECELDTRPSMEVLEFNLTTYIIRQSKCVHYEAPFIYLTSGLDKGFEIENVLKTNLRTIQ
ncbi:hypothetical protein [Pseudoalteromonas aurantia]|uniref:Uncharacterized protein n=1 Tax=Pseudoalteromonas aurantia 208 TaxID=1314867 RepID=A0ABR9EAF2_9GAMM|nr:hypothetical protein [Pseudoalteromonas aurantia]MBE0367964.1 hypothetical protein [Pseudoalteromonas aurantia 208]